MNGWLVQKHSLALNQAAPLPCVRSTEMEVWKREFIVIAMERLLAIVRKHDTRDSGGSEKLTASKTTPAISSRWNLRRHLLEYEMHLSNDFYCTQYSSYLYLGMLKHLLDWITFFLKQHSRIAKFNQLWVTWPPYSGFTRFNTLYSQVTWWGGKQMNALGRVIVPVFAATHFNPSAIQRIPLTEPLFCIKNCVYFHLMAQYKYHTNATIKYMKNYVEQCHRQKDAFSQFRFS